MFGLPFDFAYLRVVSRVFGCCYSSHRGYDKRLVLLIVSFWVEGLKSRSTVDGQNPA